MRQLIAFPVHLSVRELFLRKDERQNFWGALHLFLEEFVNAGAPGIFDRRLVPFHQELMLLRSRQERQVRKTLLGTVNDPFQQHLKMSQHASNCGSVKTRTNIQNPHPEWRTWHYYDTEGIV